MLLVFFTFTNLSFSKTSFLAFYVIESFFSLLLIFESIHIFFDVLSQQAQVCSSAVNAIVITLLSLAGLPTVICPSYELIDP